MPTTPAAAAYAQAYTAARTRGLSHWMALAVADAARKRAGRAA